MEEHTELMTMPEPNAGKVVTQPPEQNGKPPADAKQLRTEAVGALLSGAYAGASTLKLKPDEAKKLTADFPDDVVEIRPNDGICYIPHMALRDRLAEVFGPLAVAEICRERMIRTESDEIAVDLVLMIRGVFAAEGIGTARYYKNNAKTNFGDVVEAAWSEAFRRCAKKISCGTSVWRPEYLRRWIAENAVQKDGRWYKKNDPRVAASTAIAKGRSYELKPDKPASKFQAMKEAVQGTGQPDEDEDGPVPF